MLELLKLGESDFDVFKSWIKSKDELFQFAGPIFTFPLTDEQLHKYITDDRRIVYKVILTETLEVIGNAELNLENTKPRLSRILIGDISNRNKGLGKRIVDSMLDKLFSELNYNDADLNVFDWNKSAIRCYDKIGFVVNPDVVSKQNNNGEIWTAINMTISKDKWLLNKPSYDAST
jgi:RimJ/RimL family protein N-acetyltransferase